MSGLRSRQEVVRWMSSRNPSRYSLHQTHRCVAVTIAAGEEPYDAEAVGGHIAGRVVRTPVNTGVQLKKAVVDPPTWAPGAAVRERAAEIASWMKIFSS